MKAEAFRQSEQWEDALACASAAIALAPRVSKQGRSTGHLQFATLVSAYAHFARGSIPAAKQALVQLNNYGGDYMFRKAVDFKAAHLGQLVGVELESGTCPRVKSRSVQTTLVPCPHQAK